MEGELAIGVNSESILESLEIGESDLFISLGAQRKTYAAAASLCSTERLFFLLFNKDWIA